GQQQSAYTDDRGKYPSTLMAGALNHRLQDFGALLPDQFAELADDRALGGITAKCKSRNRDDDDQQRSDREDRVIGDRCTAGEVLVLDKSGNGIFDQRSRPRRTRATPPGWCFSSSIFSISTATMSARAR